MGNKFISVKTVAAIGIGAALMFVLMRFAAVPSGVPNTSLDLGIVVLSVFAAIFGPIAGLLIGFIGHMLADLTGDRIWWSWIIADALYGFVVGFLWKLYKLEEGKFGVKQALIFNTAQIVANMLAWVAAAPTLGILIYNESADKEYLQGLIAGALNIVVVLILGTLLLFGYSGTRAKAGSLKREEEGSK
jgi:energy-coupling factor transport system substrate-specific component